MKRISEILQGPEPSLKKRVTGFLLRVNNQKLLTALERDWPQDIDAQVELSESILRKTGMVYD